MSDTAAVAVRPPLPRWLWVGLVVSLALNLLLIGLIAGAAIFRHRWGGPPGVAAAAQQFGYLRTLPKERRDEIRRASGERVGQMRPLWQQAGEARREADRLFTAEPFDADRFIAAHHRMIEAEATARKEASRLLAVAGSQLSLDERRQMLSWRERHGRRWGGGRGAGQEEGGSGPAPGPGGSPQR